MAGLPCEACQEPMAVLQTAGPIEDLGGRVVLPRERVCVTPDCEFYLIRRQSAEVLLPCTDPPERLSLENKRVYRAVMSLLARREH